MLRGEGKNSDNRNRQNRARSPVSPALLHYFRARLHRESLGISAH